MSEIKSEFEVVDSTESNSVWSRQDVSVRTVLFHLGLFLVTCFSCFFVYGGIPAVPGMGISTSDAVYFTLGIIGFLTVHEFGHYFVSVFYRIRTSLPYFIPFPLPGIPVGTFGAVIRIKERVNSNIKMFDVCIAGPLAGFVVALTVLLIGFFTLPDPSHVQNFAQHEELKAYVAQTGQFPDEPLSDPQLGILMVGETLLYSFIASFFDHAPPMWEMYHYPLLYAGWLGLFFTALNLTPVGQLDGGHILYSLLGRKRHTIVARSFVFLLTIACGVGIVNYMEMLRQTSFPELPWYFEIVFWLIWGRLLFAMMIRTFEGNNRLIMPATLSSLSASLLLYYMVLTPGGRGAYAVWIAWTFLLVYFIRVKHPGALIEKPLGPVRTSLGWLSMAIFVLCISPNPLYLLAP